MIENESINQVNFRIMLSCMSLPSSIGILECPFEDKKNPFASLYFFAQLLLDPEVSFFVSGESSSDISSKIVTTTKATISTNESADYLFLSNEDISVEINRAKKGTMESPEEGATCLIFIKEISHEPSSFLLTGPGIEDFSFFPLMEGFNLIEFSRTFAKVNCEFPMGIDFIFIDSLRQIFCIPRTTKIERKVQ